MIREARLKLRRNDYNWDTILIDSLRAARGFLYNDKIGAPIILCSILFILLRMCRVGSQQHRTNARLLLINSSIARGKYYYYYCSLSFWFTERKKKKTKYYHYFQRILAFSFNVVLAFRSNVNRGTNVVSNWKLGPLERVWIIRIFLTFGFKDISPVKMVSFTWQQ